MEDGQLSNNKIGIADMVINFVPGSGNPMGIDTKEWASLSEFERLDIVLNEISKSSFEYLELAIPWINNLSDNYSFTNIMNLINVLLLNSQEMVKHLNMLMILMLHNLKTKVIFKNIVLKMVLAYQTKNLWLKCILVFLKKL